MGGTEKSQSMKRNFNFKNTTVSRTMPEDSNGAFYACKAFFRD